MPEVVPVVAGVGQRLVEGDVGGVGLLLAHKFAHQLQTAGVGLDADVMQPHLSGRSLALPREPDAIEGVVDAALDGDALRRAAYDARDVQVGARGGGLGVGVAAGGIVEGQAHGHGAVFESARTDVDGHHVAVGVAGGADVSLSAGIDESAADASVPHVEPLVHAGNVLHAHRTAVGRGQFKAERAQADAVRIAPEPPGGGGGALVVVGLGAVELAAVAVAQVEGAIGVLDAVVLHVLEPVPAPVRLRAERHSRCVFGSERLEPGTVDREGKAAVAHAERQHLVNRVDTRRIAFHQVLAVDGGAQPATAGKA